MGQNYNEPPSEIFSARGAYAWTVDVTRNARAIYVPISGTVTVQMWNDPAGTLTSFLSVPAGAILPISVKRVSVAPAGSILLS